MLFGRTKTPEEVAEEEARKAQKADAKAQQAALRAQQKAQKQAAGEWQQFLIGPQGRARQAYEAGHDILQVAFDVGDRQWFIDTTTGSTAPQQTTDATVVLNAIAHEGWDLVNGSIVFVQQRQESYDEGDSFTVEGTTMGYYLFRRNPRLEEDRPSEHLEAPQP